MVEEKNWIFFLSMYLVTEKEIVFLSLSVYLCDCKLFLCSVLRRLPFTCVYVKLS